MVWAGSLNWYVLQRNTVVVSVTALVKCFKLRKERYTAISNGYFNYHCAVLVFKLPSAISLTLISSTIISVQMTPKSAPASLHHTPNTSFPPVPLLLSYSSCSLAPFSAISCLYHKYFHIKLN